MRQGAACFDQFILQGKSAALRQQHIRIIHQAAAVAAVSQLLGGAGADQRAFELLKPAPVAFDTRQSVLDFLKRRQDCLAIGDKRLFLDGIVDVDIGPTATAVEQGPIQRRACRKGAAAPIEQAAERCADQRRGGGQCNARIEVGNGDADVGCGGAGLALTMIKELPHVKATAIDLSLVAPIAQKIVAEEGATDRVQVLAADLLSGPLPGSYDTVISRGVLQCLSAEEARLAVKNIAPAVNPEGTLFIVAQILDDSRISPLEALGYNLIFINTFDAGESYTEQQHRAWLQ